MPNITNSTKLTYLLPIIIIYGSDFKKIVFLTVYSDCILVQGE